MVAKCANHNCSAEFHRLLEGKVFVGESHPYPEAPRERRYAWLCDRCAERMTVRFDENGVAKLLVAVSAA